MPIEVQLDILHHANEDFWWFPNEDIIPVCAHVSRLWRVSCVPDHCGCAFLTRYSSDSSLRLFQSECQRLLLEEPTLCLGNTLYSRRGLRNLYQALHSAPKQLAIHVKRLDLRSLLFSDVERLLSLLFLMPNLTEVSLGWTFGSNALVPPELGIKRRRPRLVKLMLAVDAGDAYDSNLPHLAEAIKGWLDLNRLEHLELEVRDRPDVVLSKITPHLPSTLHRISLYDIPDECWDACLRIIADNFSLLQSLYLRFRDLDEDESWYSDQLANLLDALSKLRRLGLQRGDLYDLIGQARHPLLQRLDLTQVFEYGSFVPGLPKESDDPPTGFLTNHALHAAVDNVCHRRGKDAFPSLKTIQLSADFADRCNILSFATDESRRRTGVDDMARKLKDVGLVLRDENDEPWRNEWFDDFDEPPAGWISAPTH